MTRQDPGYAEDMQEDRYHLVTETSSNVVVLGATKLRCGTCVRKIQDFVGITLLGVFQYGLFWLSKHPGITLSLICQVMQ